MKKKHLSIGDMARLNKTTVSTLRFYDEMDLLKPCYTDPVSHYRFYDIKQNARFDMIQYMKELGMELKEIKEVLDLENLNKIEELLIRKKQQTLTEIEELKVKRDAIERAISSIERYKKSPSSGTITLEYIRERQIYAMDTDINFYDYDIDTYELVLKQLKEELLIHHIPQVYYCNAGTFLEKEDFIHLNFISNRIFVFVDEHFPLKGAVEKIESGMYACIYCNDFESERELAEKLLEYCILQDYEIAGDYICEVLTEFNVFDCTRRSMFLRLQVPVNFKK
ncbi:MAG: MerR family transcriptional regulator [Eubacteriales bacterium]|nr:MerR family transcriptional regulator [Eubacteriales bacterium]